MHLHKWGVGGKNIQITATSGSGATAKIRAGKYLITIKTEEVQIRRDFTTCATGQGSPLAANSQIYDRYDVDTDVAFFSTGGTGIVTFVEVE